MKSGDVISDGHLLKHKAAVDCPSFVRSRLSPMSDSEFGKRIKPVSQQVGTREWIKDFGHLSKFNVNRLQ